MQNSCDSDLSNMERAGGKSPGGVLSGGAVHSVPSDLEAGLREAGMEKLWEGLTVLGRNEFICWVEDAKKAPTRARRIKRTVEELAEGKRRPCCWPGCKHRTKG